MTWYDRCPRKESREEIVCGRKEGCEWVGKREEEGGRWVQSAPSGEGARSEGGEGEGEGGERLVWVREGCEGCYSTHVYAEGEGR